MYTYRYVCVYVCVYIDTHNSVTYTQILNS